MDQAEAKAWLRQRQQRADDATVLALMQLVKDSYARGLRRGAEKVHDFGRALEESARDIERMPVRISE